MKVHDMHFTPAGPTIHVRPWADPVVDELGHDPRSTYVERFWLGVLGPSTTLLLRRIAAGLEQSPSGFDLSLAETARALGIGGDGRHSPFVRALGRCCQFEMARPESAEVLAVRRKLPPLSRRHLVRLPESLQAEHQAWVESRLREPEIERLRRRSRRLALSLLELGEDPEATERQLQRWRFHPALCHESTRWAQAQHASAEPDEQPLPAA
jgi:hypothetical protein